MSFLLPCVTISVTNVSSSNRISIYGRLSFGAEHHAPCVLSSRAREGAWFGLNCEDAVMLLSGIDLFCIPRTASHSPFREKSHRLNVATHVRK